MNASVINIVAFSTTFLAMEGVAWFTHKYIMHGFLWNLHEDHHQPHKGFFEKNDLFFIIFAVPSFFLILFGANAGYDYRTFIGFGIMAYGFVYSFVHDVIIHQRFKIFSRSKNNYVMGIRKGHKIHHKHLGKEDGECFGMLLVPFKYFKEAKKANKSR